MIFVTPNPGYGSPGTAPCPQGTKSLPDLKWTNVDLSSVAHPGSVSMHLQIIIHRHVWYITSVFILDTSPTVHTRLPFTTNCPSPTKVLTCKEESGVCQGLCSLEQWPPSIEGIQTRLEGCILGKARGGDWALTRLRGLSWIVLEGCIKHNQWQSMFDHH